jgi:peptidoglycan/LPS O-acetylase OafA/YrhL
MAGRGFIVELQSVRGLAALLVVFSHTLNFFRWPGPEDWTAPINGHAGVVIFFVLSGFVLSRSLAAIGTLADTIRWYVRRLFRIYPAIWAASLLAVAYLAFLHWQVPVPDESDWMRGRYRADRWDVLHVAASFAGMLAFLLPQLWTLTVELIGSFFMPLFKRVMDLGRAPTWILFAALLLISLLFGERSYYGVAAYMIDFAIGMALAELPAARVQFLAPFKGALGVAGVGMLLLSRWGFNGSVHALVPHMIELVGAVLVVVLVVNCRLGGRTLQWRPIVWLGNISYSVYLAHFPVMSILSKLVEQAPVGTAEKNVLLTAATIAVTLPLSHLLFKFVEQPGNDLGRRVTSMRRSPAPAGA